MAETPSRMVALGTVAPEFKLIDCHGRSVSLSEAHSAKAILIMFICNHCPFVIHVQRELARVGRDYASRGVAIFAINSNDAERYPADDVAGMRRAAAEAGYTFPYLVDSTQQVAAVYGAACTPDFFLFDGARRLVYRGQLDDSRPGNGIPVTGRDLRTALECLLSGQPVSPAQRPSLGCNIKWKPGR